MRSAAGSVRPVTLAHTPSDQPRVCQPLSAAWLGALDVEGHLSFVDISPILADGPGQLLWVLWRRTNGKVARHGIDTTAGPMWVYLSTPGNAPHHALRRPPGNTHGRDLLRQWGLNLTYCAGPVLFTGRDGGGDPDREVGLSLRQQQALQHATGSFPTPPTVSPAVPLASRLPLSAAGGGRW